MLTPIADHRPATFLEPSAAADVVVCGSVDGNARIRARLAGRPCLLLVEPGEAPPTGCNRHEDWIVASAPAADIERRREALRRRPSPTGLVADLDALDVHGNDVRVLGGLDARPGHATSRAGLLALVDEPGHLDDALRRLRGALRPAGLELVVVDGGDVVVVRAARQGR